MDALECLKTRRSVRVYRPDPVPKEVIEEIVDHARFSPSAMNEQPWVFVAVTQPSCLRQLAELTDYGKHIAAAPACIAVFCRRTKYYLEDGCAATMAILLAAWAYGLGTCWVAGDKKVYAGEIGRLLQVPEDHQLVSLISLGFPAEHPVKTKHALHQVLHWEHFGSPASLHPPTLT